MGRPPRGEEAARTVSSTGGPSGSRLAQGLQRRACASSSTLAPLQEPERAPATAAYLEGLLAAFDSEPLAGRIVRAVPQSDLRRSHAAVRAPRRGRPPAAATDSAAASAAMTVDPFLLRGASLGAAWRAERRRRGRRGLPRGRRRAPPIAPACRWWSTLLDLAPWELPGAFQRARRGPLRATAPGPAAPRSRGRDRRDRGSRRRHEAPAADPAQPDQGRSHRATPGIRAGRTGRGPAGEDAQRERLGLPDRYLVYAGRYDARQDLSSLLRALAELAKAGRPAVPRAGGSMATAHPAGGCEPGGSCGPRPGRGQGGCGRRPRLRAAVARRSPRSAGARGARRGPAGPVRGGRVRGDRRAGLWHAGDRQRRWSSPRAGRLGGHPRPPTGTAAPGRRPIHGMDRRSGARPDQGRRADGCGASIHVGRRRNRNQAGVRRRWHPLSTGRGRLSASARSGRR